MQKYLKNIQQKLIIMLKINIIVQMYLLVHVSQRAHKYCLSTNAEKSKLVLFIHLMLYQGSSIS